MSEGTLDIKWQQMLTDAAQAEEMFGADELERYADEQRAKEQPQTHERAMEIINLAGRRAETLRLYRKYRRKALPNYTATTCLSLARHEIKYHQMFAWDTPVDTRRDQETLEAVTTTKLGPLTFVTRIIADNDMGPSMDDNGKFESGRYSTPQDGAHSRPNHEAVWLEVSSNHEWSCGWFESSYSYEERRKDYEKLGRQRAHELAREMLRKDAERFRAFYRDDWSYVGIQTKVWVFGIELGSEALWGIDFDGRDYSYINEIAEEQLNTLRGTALTEIEMAGMDLLEQFGKLMKAGAELQKEDWAERGKWLDKMIDQSIVVGEKFPRAEDTEGGDVTTIQL